MSDDAVDVLAVMAHPDDAELVCGGTLARAAEQGYRTGILDLTGGETGTYGNARIRATEAERAAEILGVAVRRSAGLPDGALQNTNETRAIVAAHLRQLRPRTVILHGSGGRHPDHRVARQLGYDASFLAGLRGVQIEGEPHRPRKILYALAYLEKAPHPSFVVDITAQIDQKLNAIFAFASQFEGRTWAGEIFGGGGRPLREQILVHAAHYGSLIRRAYGEPFRTRETVQVDDIVDVPVNSF